MITPSGPHVRQQFFGRNWDAYACKILALAAEPNASSEAIQTVKLGDMIETVAKVVCIHNRR